MKVAKIKETKKNEKVKDVEEYTLKQMLTIILVLLAVFVLFYFITSIVVNNRKKETKTNTIVEFDNSKILLNNLLNKKESEYYVLAYMQSKYDIGEYSKINYMDVYNNYINQYKTKDGALNFYYVDLDDALNKSYISDESNIGEDLSDLKINDEVLFKISNGKIKEHYIGNDAILEKLKNNM